MLTDRLTANLSVSLFLWDKITHLKDIKMPFGTLVPSLLARLFQRGCNTRTTALERLYQQLWNKCNNCCGTVVTTAVVRLEQLCLRSSSNYLIVIHTNPSMSILYISGCGDFTFEMNISIYIGRYVMRSTTRRLSLHKTSALFSFFHTNVTFPRYFTLIYVTFPSFLSKGVGFLLE